jgi:hypothetical protein
MIYPKTTPNLAKLLMSLLLLLAFAIPTQGQVPRRIKDRVKDRTTRKIEDRVVRKVDEAVDKVLDKVEESVEESAKKDPEESETDEGGREEVEAGTEMENVRVTVEEDDSPYVPVANEFKGTFTVRIENYGKNGKMAKDSPAWMTYTFDTWQTGFKMEGQDAETSGATMIFNLKDNTIVTKINQDGKKQAMRMKRPRIKTTVENVHSDEEIEITNTGITETINGYPCVKYLVVSPSEESEVWITKSVDLNYANIAQNFNTSVGTRNKASQYNTNIYGLEEGGVPMRTITKQKNGEYTKTEIESLEEGKVDQDILSLEGYEVMSLPGFGGR